VCLDCSEEAVRTWEAVPAEVEERMPVPRLYEWLL
jgi:hypothetical protein